MTQGRAARRPTGATARPGAGGETIAARRRVARRACRLPLRPFALCLTVVALAGCGSDGDDDTPRSDDEPPGGDDRSGLVVAGLYGRPAAEVSSPWLVNTRLFRNASDTPSTGEATVDLLRYEDDFPVSRHLDFFARTLDTCKLQREDDGSGEDDGSPPPTIGGGATLTIDIPSGPWLVLERQTQEDGTEVTYRRAFGEWPGELPGGATLSIPGEAFPDVAAYPLEEPAAPIRLLPGENEPLDADTVYRWVPGEGSDHIEITFIALTPGGDFIDFPLACDVVDDGSFELPREARDFVATATDDLRMRYERVRQIVELADGIVFRTVANVAE